MSRITFWRAAFWGAAFTIAWTYVLFPVVVVARGLLRPRPVRRAAIEPAVSLVIAARNEAGMIGRKLANVEALDYPGERLEVVVVSDGSTDGTEAIVAAAAGESRLHIRLVALPPSGKAAALNAVVPVTHGEILVFSDANSMYAPDALRELVGSFADPEVGGVAGNQVYLAGDRDLAAGETGSAGERGYWGYDRLVKEFESRAGSAIAGTGAIYAIRRELFRPIPPGVNDDFYQTAGVIEQGHRLVFERRAVAYERPAGAMDAEFARKVRVVSRAMRCVRELSSLLDVRRRGFYALQLFSHKVLRWAMPAPLAVLLVTSFPLAARSRFHGMALAAQLAAYGLAAVGILGRAGRAGRRRVVAIPAYFVMVNAAAVLAAWNLVRGVRIDRWDPGR